MVTFMLMRSVCASHTATHMCIARSMQRHFGINQLLRLRPKEVIAHVHTSAMISIA